MQFRPDVTATIELDTLYISIRYVGTLAPLRDMLILRFKRKEKGKGVHPKFQAQDK